MNGSIRIIHLSDTHSNHRQIPAAVGDLLIMSGDICKTGNQTEFLEALDWLAAYPCAYRVYVPGNHDSWVAEQPDQAAAHCQDRQVALLIDSGIEASGFRIWGCPWVPYDEAWHWPNQDRAFCLPAGSPELAARYAAIPKDTELLICHCPPQGIGDLTPADGYWAGLKNGMAGSPQLWEAVESLPNLFLATFGHNHDNPGLQRHGDCWFSNAARCQVIMDWNEGRLTRVAIETAIFS